MKNSRVCIVVCTWESEPHDVALRTTQQASLRTSASVLGCIARCTSKGMAPLSSTCGERGGGGLEVSREKVDVARHDGFGSGRGEGFGR